MFPRLRLKAAAYWRPRIGGRVLVVAYCAGHVMLSGNFSSQSSIKTTAPVGHTALTDGSEPVKAVFNGSHPDPCTSGRDRRRRARSSNMENIMNYLVNLLGRSGLLTRDLDYHLLRAAMVVIFAWFGYDKWFDAEITGLIPLITHGPLIFWMIPVLGVGGTSILLGTAEWTFGSLLLLGYWNKKL